MPPPANPLKQPAISHWKSRAAELQETTFNMNCDVSHRNAGDGRMGSFLTHSLPVTGLNYQETQTGIFREHSMISIGDWFSTR